MQLLHWPVDPGPPFQVLCELVRGALHRFYETAGNAGVPRDEGEWIYPVRDTHDVVTELCLEGGIDGEVNDRVVELFDDEAWVPRYEPHESPDAPLRRGWERFCEHVKHQSRFLLMRADDLDESEWFPERLEPPRKTLKTLAGVLSELGLVTTMETTTPVYRARTAEQPTFTSKRDFTSPPPNLAAQGRMNPAGIPMFYGALDQETAAVEVYRGLPYAAVATWFPTRALRVVDLTRAPSPSPFDPSIPLRDVYMAAFLRGFIDDISKPIVDDDRVHREYIPTQIFTEYLRYRLLSSPAALDGILFPSSINPRRHECRAVRGPLRLPERRGTGGHATRGSSDSGMQRHRVPNVRVRPATAQAATEAHV